MHKIKWFFLAFALTAIDYISKILVVSNFAYGEIKPIFPGFSLIRTHNYGVAFGGLRDFGISQGNILLAITIMITLVLVIWLCKASSRVTNLALALIVGGAVGNILDRVLYGYVIDFLHFYIYDWQWPDFNLADSFITIGAMLIIYTIWIGERDGSGKS